VAAASNGRLRVDVDEFLQPPGAPGIPSAVKIVNIAATLPGTHPDSTGRIYVIAAHYDSRASDPLDVSSPAPGADDDASGVAAVLELARVMSAYEFPATIVFLTVAGEEQGNAGSAHWAQQAREHGMDIAAMFDESAIGNTHAADDTIDRSSVNLFAGGDENDAPARELARAVKDIASRYAFPIGIHVSYRPDSIRGGGDHVPFLERGYPAVRFSEATGNPHHRYQDDRTDFIDFAYVADVARMNAVVLAELAHAPASPRKVAIDSSESGVVLRWTTVVGTNLAGYRVVWRDSVAPFWEHSLDLPPNAASATLPHLSRDTTIFGLEAFDSAGHVSPATLAQ
jgi:Zn-dependent M28 family amino/carboxypeptidase